MLLQCNGDTCGDVRFRQLSEGSDCPRFFSTRSLLLTCFRHSSTHHIANGSIGTAFQRIGQPFMGLRGFRCGFEGLASPEEGDAYDPSANAQT